MFKRVTSGLLTLALTVTLFFGGADLRVFGDEAAAGAEAEKLVVYVAFEGKDDAGHQVDTGKLPVQVDEGAKADVAVKEALEAAGYKPVEQAPQKVSENDAVTAAADGAGVEVFAAEPDMTYDLQNSNYGAYLNAVGGMGYDAATGKSWLFFVDGVSSAVGMSSVALREGTELSFIYTADWQNAKQQCAAFDDDNSHDPDAAKRKALIASAKQQQQILAKAVFEKYFQGKTSAEGLTNPDELYVAYSLLGAGYPAGDFYRNTLAKVKEQLKTLKDSGKLDVTGALDDADKPFGTDLSGGNNNIELSLAKLVLFVTAMGENAADIENVNLIQMMVDKRNYQASAKAYMLNCTMLLALDSKDYPLPEGDEYLTRKDLVEPIVEEVGQDISNVIGGWSPDSLAMPLQPLCRYLDEKTAKGAFVDAAKVKKETDRALIFLAKLQNRDGNYYSYGSKDMFSLAQIMDLTGRFHIPLTAAWKSGEKTYDFIKNGVTLFDVSASFVDVKAGKVDEKLMDFQPEQLLRGLNASIKAAEEREPEIAAAEQKSTPETKPTDNSSDNKNEAADSTETVKTVNKCVSLKAKKKTVTVKRKKTIKITFSVKAETAAKKTTDQPKVTIKNKKLAKVKKTKLAKNKLVITVLGKKKGSTKLTVKLGKKKATVTIKIK